MLILGVYITEKWRRILIVIYIILSSFAFVFSYMQFFFGVYGIEAFDAGLTALEKRGEQDLSYILIVAGLTGMKIHFLGITVCFSQIFANKRTLGYTRLMALLNIIKLLQMILEIANVVLHHKASFQPLADRTDGFLRAMYKYGYDEHYRTAVDEVQHTFRCCGNQNFKDWLDITWFSREFSFNNIKKEVPFSCCNSDVQPPCLHDDVIANYREAIATSDTKPLTVYKDGCLKVFYDFYSDYAIYAVSIPGCFKVALYFCLIPLLRYIETSIYWALRTGFPQSSGFGYLLSLYDEGPKPKKLSETDRRVMSLVSLNLSENSASTASMARNRSIKFADTTSAHDTSWSLASSSATSLSPTEEKNPSALDVNRPNEKGFRKYAALKYLEESSASPTSASSGVPTTGGSSSVSASSSATSVSPLVKSKEFPTNETRRSKTGIGNSSGLKSTAPTLSDGNSTAQTNVSATSSFTSVSSSIEEDKSVPIDNLHVKTSTHKHSAAKPLVESSALSEVPTTTGENSSVSASSSATSFSPEGANAASSAAKTGETRSSIYTADTSGPTVSTTTASKFRALSSANMTSNSAAGDPSSFSSVPSLPSSLMEHTVSFISSSSTSSEATSERAMKRSTRQPSLTKDK